MASAQSIRVLCGHRPIEAARRRTRASAKVVAQARRFAWVAVALIGAAAARPAAAAETFDAAGNVGATSYATLPFVSNVYQNCWGCTPGLVPATLFYRSNSQSFYANAQNLATVRLGVATLERRGQIPAGGAQLWEDTYAASFPAGTFSGEPSYVQTDRNLGYPTMPDFVAWRNFITAHPQYWDVAFDGGTMPPDFRSWNAQWGHISPLTPLDPADCPPGMATCTWGDNFAYLWALSVNLTGGYGIMLSDFSDSQPDYLSTVHDFNPRIVAAFAQAEGVTVPAGSVTAQSTWIVANAFAQWNDFLSVGYGKFFNALALRLGAAAARVGLVVDQCSWTPSAERLRGVDARLIAQQMDLRSYLCIWDEHLIQTDRPGPIANPPMQELAGPVINAAREPRVRNGANLEANDAAYQAAIAQFYPGLTASAQQEVGLKLLKRLWLWSAWAHIADTSGNVRRALAFTSRDYWDVGDLGVLDPLTTLIQTIVPARPFGPALYYSVAIERATEIQQGIAAGAGQTPNSYLQLPDLQQILDAHGLGYYVSDEALGTIKKGAASAPSAWLVLDPQNMLPAAERQSLAAIAPVVNSVAALAALANQPLNVPPGMAGFGFYDQYNRLILVVSNPSSLPTAQPVSGQVRLSQLAPGTYSVTELFTGAQSSLTVGATASASLPVSLSRWDTTVLALVLRDARPNPRP